MCLRICNYCETAIFGKLNLVLPSEPETFVQRLPDVFQTPWRLQQLDSRCTNVAGVWNTSGSRCTNVAGSLGIGGKEEKSKIKLRKDFRNRMCVVYGLRYAKNSPKTWCQFAVHLLANLDAASKHLYSYAKSWDKIKLTYFYCKFHTNICVPFSTLVLDVQTARDHLSQFSLHLFDPAYSPDSQNSITWAEHNN